MKRFIITTMDYGREDQYATIDEISEYLGDNDCEEFRAIDALAVGESTEQYSDVDCATFTIRRIE